MKVIHTLKPIYDNNSKVLILGSMPSIKSRELNFYYANPNNRFWSILEILFETKLTNNKEKEDFIHESSSDASISNYEFNDLSSIFNCANIKAIFITGKTAYNAFIKHYKLNIPIIYLPSPSSANAKESLKNLVNSYKVILEFL